MVYTLVEDYYYPYIALEAEKELEEIERKISSLGKYAKQRQYIADFSVMMSLTVKATVFQIKRKYC
ncbi:MAG: hypothetical protein KBT46_09040 [Ruminococcus sp.]|nr:hypothetical protein [Candidatus Copronaster equi]